MSNKLIIAGAGSGKTTYLVKRALEINEPILITTFTIANEQEIRKKFRKLNGCVPGNVTIQTWYSFLLQHGVRPFQGALTSKKINGMILVSSRSGIKFYTKNKQPVYFSEEKEFDKFYFTPEYKMYSDKIAKFVTRCNDETEGLVIQRIAKIYDYVFIDEIQDLAGYDLELVKLLLESSSNILMVGDPRQVTYHTHDEAKYKKYNNGNIEEFISKECNKIECEIDETTLCDSYRNNQIICAYANLIYPDFKPCGTKQSEVTDHDGVFLIKKSDIDNYLKEYNPIQLRDSRRTEVNNNYSVMNMGESKGLTFKRVLIYPTKPILDWMKDHSKTLKDLSQSKFYVAVTRAKHSVAIVCDFTSKSIYPDIQKYIKEG